MDTKKINLLRVGDDIVVSTLNLTKALIKEFGGRIAGSGQCLATGKKIAELFKPHCDKVSEEIFTIHPGSFCHVGKIVALSYLLSIIFLMTGSFFVYISLAINLFGLIYGITHYILFKKPFDMFFPSAKGCNVAGIIEPNEKIKQQVLVVGHHDSAYVLSFLEHVQIIAGIRLMVAMVTYLVLTILCIFTFLDQLIFKTMWTLQGVQLWLLVIGFIFVFPLYFLFTKKISPGAGDNLNAISMVIKIAEYFSLNRKQGFPLKNTRLILLSTDAEEAGLRGALDYAERHKTDLLSIPTFVINMDSIFQLPCLSILTRDRNNTISLSVRMAEDLVELASELGIPLKKIALPLGSGGTDAAAFMSCGIESASIIGISTSLLIKDVVYHTSNDTVDHIQPEAVKATLELIINYIRIKDEQA